MGGTRHLIAVQVDGDYKVAQYGQWDGYPSDAGLEVLQFLESLIDSDDRTFNQFRDAVRRCSWLTEEEKAKIDRELELVGPPNVNFYIKNMYPELSRDTGAEILELVFNSRIGRSLIDRLNFAGDSLLCEWAYVIDLDQETFEVYKGFNTEPLDSNERFSSFEDFSHEPTYSGYRYYPIKLIAKWSLYRLPSQEAFLEILNKEEDCD